MSDKKPGTTTLFRSASESTHWTGKFNCSKEELLQARNAVRVSSEKVTEYIRTKNTQTRKN
jgi:hypothetical protein